jgi:predicted kinase
MSQRNLIILKGVSGSGKTTFAKLIEYPCCICTADDYFYDKNGQYNFDLNKLGLAHAACRDKFDEAIKDPIITNIVIANTNTKESDYSYYVNRAEKFGVNVMYVILEKRHDNPNVHNVPDFVLDRQEKNIIQTLKLR